jgi:uncharacterized protein
MKRFLGAIAFALAICATQPAAAGPNFPDRGRAGVVDAANVIPDHAERALNDQVVRWDRTTGHQLVVVTVPSLQGYDVKDFGYQLGRAWGLGRKGQDDGAILLLAPTERKVRVEVGYGLEPVLTDATSAGIIADQIVPRLKAGDAAGGLAAGADQIMATVDAAKSAAVVRPAQPEPGGWWRWWLIAALVGCGALALWRAARYHRQARALADRRRAREVALLDGAAALRRFASQSAGLGTAARRSTDRPFAPTPPRLTRTVGPVSGPSYAPTTYASPPPPPPPSHSYDGGSSSSGSSDWGSGWGGSDSGSSSDSGFDSGGGSFGGGGADSSY